MANYNSRFNINDAFEDFKQKQHDKTYGQLKKEESGRLVKSFAGNNQRNNKWQVQTVDINGKSSNPLTQEDAFLSN